MTGRIVIAGASGVVGSAALEAFLDDGWDVVALSRRPPEIRSSRPFQHIRVDLQDQAASQAALQSLEGVTHLAFAALYELPGLIDGWADPRQMEANLAMLRHCVEPLSRAGTLRHVTIMQGTKAYGVHLHAMDLPARETAPRDPHANFYWLQEDYIKERAAGADFSYTVLRPPMVMGGAVGAAMNLAPVLGAYAAICREEGSPFGFPGGAPYVTEALDARVLAQAFLWAARAPSARNEIFNISNGDVFEWRGVWGAIAESLGVEVGPDRPMLLSEYLPTKSSTWDRIVEKHGLRKIALKDFLGESHFIADFCFLAGVTETPRPGLMSTIKIRQAGFHHVCDTEDMLRYWLGDLIDRNYLPAPD